MKSEIKLNRRQKSAQCQTQTPLTRLMGVLQICDTNLRLQPTPAMILYVLQLREMAAEVRESRKK